MEEAFDAEVARRAVILHLVNKTVKALTGDVLITLRGIPGALISITPSHPQNLMAVVARNTATRRITTGFVTTA